MEKEAKDREERAAFEAHQAQVIAEIERQDQALRREFPALEDDDMDAIYKIAANMQGDLYQAKEYFDALNDRIVTNYVARKKAAPKNQAPRGTGAIHSEEPVVIESVKQAHPLAVERATQLLNAE